MLTTEGIARAYAMHAGDDVRQLGAVLPGTVVRTYRLAGRAPAVGKAIRDLGLPMEALVVSVERAGMTVIPRGGTVLAAGDVLHVVQTPAVSPRVEAALTGLG